jgi:drug/metabolite transporter (DMT)-like permease
MTKYRLNAYIYLLLVAAIWGIAGPVIKYTLPDFPPFIFLSYRFLISIIFLLPFVIIKGVKLPKNKRDLITLVVISLLGSSINLGFLFYGYKYTSVLDASILSSSSPLFVVAAGAIFLKEKVTKREKVGLLIAFCGSVVIVLQPLIEGGFFALQNLLGNLLIISANFTWVAYIILSKIELRHKVDPFTITFFMFFLGFLTLLPLAIIQSGGFLQLTNQVTNSPINSHLGVWYMALLSGNLAYFLYQKGQKSIEASEATLFTYLSPLFAAPLAVYWLGEKVTTPFVVGVTIIAVGVFIAEYKKRVTKKHKDSKS